MKKVLFISSTGGHFNELRKLEELFDFFDTTLVVEKQRQKPNLVKKEYALPYGTRKYKIRYCAIFLLMVLKSCYIFARENPEVIVTTGSHTAVPMCYLGWLFKRKVIFLESIARVRTKSLTGILIEHKCDIILVQWESMLTVYDKAQYVGRIL
ncbi:hypothetical protein AwErysi_08960 [Erysipelotrichaceae bacterium]|nr:hypothetical protein AwErysi_08960 [Erysipelotrichaceae bacterium]